LVEALRAHSKARSKRARRQKAKTRKRRAAPTMRRRRSSADQADEVDIDDRRKRALESEYKLRQIIDTVPGIVWATGPDGENTYANQRLLDYIGVSHKDFRKCGWQNSCTPTTCQKL
jgi:PAS domain-containing protein